MHKKLLLVMLVPILAFSLVVIGCGGDDVFDGNEAPSWFQGAFESERIGGADNTWFVITGNQITMFDQDMEARIAFRIDFSILGGTTWLQFAGNALEANVSQEKMIQRMAIVMMDQLIDVDGYWMLGTIGNISEDSLTLIEELAEFDGNLDTIAGQMAFNALLGDDEFWYILSDWSQTYAAINSIFMEGGTPVAFCRLTFPRVWGADEVMRDFVDGETEFFDAATLGAWQAIAGWDGYLFASFNAGHDMADRIVPFRIEYRHFDSEELLGYNEGFWVLPDNGAPENQFLIITQRNRRLDVMTEYLPEVGVWTHK